MKKIFLEEQFYQNNGEPMEEYAQACVDKKYDVEDSESTGQSHRYLLLVTNSRPMYIRKALEERVGFIVRDYPCGGGVYVTPTFRDNQAILEEICPKIAFGYAAYYLSNLRWYEELEDFKDIHDISEVQQNYYNIWWREYEFTHSGKKYDGVSNDDKRRDFLVQHLKEEEKAWERNEPLKELDDYTYELAKEATHTYLSFLKQSLDAFPSRAEVGHGSEQDLSQETTPQYIKDMPKNLRYNKAFCSIIKWLIENKWIERDGTGYTIKYEKGRKTQIAFLCGYAFSGDFADKEGIWHTGGGGIMPEKELRSFFNGWNPCSTKNASKDIRPVPKSALDIIEKLFINKGC